LPRCNPPDHDLTVFLLLFGNYSTILSPIFDRYSAFLSRTAGRRIRMPPVTVREDLAIIRPIFDHYLTITTGPHPR
jgi:hypothetical protein